MSTIDNKLFIKKSQEIFKDLGIEVKTTQLYEFYSRLMGEKNWNQAKNKNPNFAQDLGVKNQEFEFDFNEGFQLGVISLCLKDKFFFHQILRYFELDEDFKEIKLFSNEAKKLFTFLVDNQQKGNLTSESLFLATTKKERPDLVSTLEKALSHTESSEETKNHINAFVKQVKMSAGFKKTKKAWDILPEQATEIMEEVIKDINLVSFNAPNEKLSHFNLEEMTLEEMVLKLHLIDQEKFVFILHSRMLHNPTAINSKIDPYGLSLIAQWTDKESVAIMIRTNQQKVTAKHIHSLAKGMEANSCKKGIIYTSSENLPSALYKLAQEHEIELVDQEDLLRIARTTDKK